MDTREMFLSRPECKLCGFKNFYSNLQALREQLHNTVGQAEKDSQAFKAFKKNCPAKPLCSRGCPHWEGSVAQKQLKLDIDDGVHEMTDPMTGKKVTPMKLWSDEEKPECREFPQKVFRGHTCQELRTRKHYNCLEKKEEDQKAKKLKKHNKAVEKIQKTKQKEMEKQHMEGLIEHSTLRKKLHEGDLKLEPLHRGAEETDCIELRTFTNRKKMLVQLEEDSLAHEAEWIKTAATEGFKKLSAAEFALPQATKKEQ